MIQVIIFAKNIYHFQFAIIDNETNATQVRLK